MSNFDFQALNKEKLFYDLPNYYDAVNFKPRKGGNNEFGTDVIKVVPAEGEVRLIGNRHRECLYYAIGLSKCKEKLNLHVDATTILSYQIIDCLGHIVLSEKVNNLNLVKVNISNLNSGAYLVKVQTPFGAAQRSTVIE